MDEITVRSIGKDGAMKGYDFDFVRIRCVFALLMTVLLGAQSNRAFDLLITAIRNTRAAVGLFAFAGVNRTPLTNQASRADENALYETVRAGARR